MRLTLLTSGTRGDVQPYLALGIGLREAGHDVVIATHAAFANAVVQCGLTFAQIEPNLTALMMQGDGQMALTYEGNPLRAAQASLRFLRTAQARFGELLDSALAASRHSDAIIAGLPTLWGSDIAAALGVPCHWALLQPITRSAHFAHPMLPFSPPRVLHRASYQVVEWATWLPWRRAINQWRKKQGLPAAPIRQRYQPLYAPSAKVAYGFSVHVVPKPPDWPAHHHIVGYWFLNPSAPPSDELKAYVAQHQRLVYLGVGSMQPSQIQPFIAAAEQALAANAAWGVMLRPPRTHTATSQRILFVDEAPHTWLFPHMNAIVHHGGAGTTAAALRAGRPQIITPIAADQFFWAARTHALGVAPRPAPLHQLTAASLGTDLAQCLNDIRLQTCAQRLGQSIAAEDGVAAAAQIFS